MEKQDARSLSEEAQEDLRRRVVEAVQKGLSQTEAARVFAVARGTVSRWMGLVKRAGRRALKARRRGRPPVSRLAPHQAATTVRMILSGCPDQLSLPFALWTREAVQQLLSRKFDVQVSVWTVGRYLRAWGLTPQKPVRRAYEQDPVAVRKWLKEEYPAIRAQARQWKAANSLAGRDGAAFGPSGGTKLRTPRADAGRIGHRPAFSLQHDLFDHQSRAIVLHDFPAAFHGAGVSEFFSTDCCARRGRPGGKYF